MHICPTCDVEKDLYLLVSGGASDPSVPLGALGAWRALLALHATALLPTDKLSGAWDKSWFKVGVVLGALRTPAVTPTSWYWWKEGRDMLLKVMGLVLSGCDFVHANHTNRKSILIVVVVLETVTLWQHFQLAGNIITATNVRELWSGKKQERWNNVGEC